MGHWCWNSWNRVMWGGDGTTGWQRVGTEWGDEGCVCAGVISTKSVPYDTHSHGLCLDSLFLSVWPSLYLSGPVQWRKKSWGAERRAEVDIFSATTGALWWQRPGHVTHQGLRWLSLSRREGFIKYPLLFLTLSLWRYGSIKRTHHYWGLAHSLISQSTSSIGTHNLWLCTHMDRERRKWMKVW